MTAKERKCRHCGDRGCRLPMVTVRLRFVEDPRHGWVEVPMRFVRRLGMGWQFSSRGDMAYLEEDCELSELKDRMKKHHMKLSLDNAYVDDFDLWLGSPDWPLIVGPPPG